MNIEEILDALEDMLEEAWSIPLSGNKCVIDAEPVRPMIPTFSPAFIEKLTLWSTSNSPSG